MAQCADCGGGKDNGAVKTDDGIIVHTPQGGIFVDTTLQEGEKKTVPPVNTFNCDPWESECAEVP